MSTFVSTGCCGYGATQTPAGGGNNGGGNGSTISIVSMIHIAGKIVTLLSDGTTIQCPYNSDVVTEGSTNKYFTDLRRQAILDAISSEAIARQTADSNLQTALGSHEGSTSNPHQVSLEQARNKNNKIAGNIDADGNQIDNLANAITNQQAVTLNQLTAMKQEILSEVDTSGFVHTRWIADYDPATNGKTFPSSGSGAGGAVRTGDTWDINTAGGVTEIHGIVVETGDTIRAKVDNPGQTIANWHFGEGNIGQATESVLGKLKISSQSAVEDKNTTNNTDSVTPLRFWQGIATFLQTAWTFAAKQTFSGGIKLTGVASKFLKTDANGDVVGADKVQPSEIGTDSNNRFVTDAEKTAWNGKENADNKTSDIAGNAASTVKFGTIKGWIDWLKQGFTAALTTKVTLVDADSFVMDDSADGNKTKKISWANVKAALAAFGFWKAGDIAFPYNSNGQPSLMLPITGDILAAATKKFTVTLAKGGGAPSAVPAWALFTNNYGQNYNVADAGSYGVINIDFETKFRRLTYSQGYLFIHFYYTYIPASAPTVRFKKWSGATGGTETWVTIPAPVNISTNADTRVYKYTIPTHIWTSDIEITVNALPDRYASIASIEYFPTSFEKGLFPIPSNYAEVQNDIYTKYNFRNNNNEVKATIDNQTGKLTAVGFTENGQDLSAKYEPKIVTKNTAFNKNFGTTADTVAQGNDSRFHTHSNQSVLDGITAGKVTAWDGKADAATTYTKTEVDAKVSSVYRIKGSVATVAALPATGNTLGDVYNVIATGQNYVWVGGTDGDLGNGWDSLGGSVDLSGYYTKVESLDKFEPKIVSKNDAFNKKFGEDADNVARGNHTHNLSSLNNDVNFQTYDDVDTAVREAIADLKAGVSTEGDTLKKLYDLIISSLTEIHVDNIPERDNLNITKLPTNVFVLDDGDGRWALYKATSTGINASFVKISDPDLLNAVMSASQIKSAYESNPNTNAFSNVYKNRLEYIATLAEADQVQNSGQDRTYNVNGRELLIGNALLLTLQTILGTGLKLKNNGEVEVLSTNQLAAKFKRGNGVRLYNTDGKELTLHNEAATQDISIKVPDEGGSRFMATREWVELTKYAYENIADGEDLNDYRTSGLFNLNRDYSYYGHTPTQGDAFVFALLRITKIDGGAVQEIIGLDTANDRLNTFKRFYNKENDYWTEWQKTITSNEVSDTQMYNWTIAYNAMTSLQNGVAKYTKTTGSTYNVLPTDYIIAVLANTTTTINLPSTSDVPNGKVYEFCSYGDFSGTSYIGGAGAQLYAASGDKFHHPINNSSKTSFQFKNTLDSNSNNALSLKIMKDGNSWIVLQTSSFDY